MTIDYLQAMGIERWQQRKVAVKPSAQEIKAVINQDIPSNELLNEEIHSEFSAYAASSLRLDSQGQKCRWLWVLPQSSLNAEELQLIDKMVVATGSQWELGSIADNYLASTSLDNILSQELAAVIFLADKINWPAFEQHNLCSEKRYIYAGLAKSLIEKPEQKRLVWQKLQTLMV